MLIKRPETAVELIAIIRAWLNSDDPTHWGEFELDLDYLIQAHDTPADAGRTPLAAIHLLDALDADPSIGEAFQSAFQAQLHKRHKARFKQAPSADEVMSAEEAGLRAALGRIADDRCEASTDPEAHF